MSEDGIIQFPNMRKVLGRDDILGPTDGLHALVVDGRELPALIRGKELENGNFYVVVDGRFACEVEVEGGDYGQVYQWLWLMGNAVAIASGWASLGHDRAQVDVFAPEVMRVGGTDD